MQSKERQKRGWGRKEGRKKGKRWYLKNNTFCLRLKRKKSPKTKHRAKQKLEMSLQIELDPNKSHPF